MGLSTSVLRTFASPDATTAAQILPPPRDRIRAAGVPATSEQSKKRRGLAVVEGSFFSPCPWAFIHKAVGREEGVTGHTHVVFRYYSFSHESVYDTSVCSCCRRSFLFPCCKINDKNRAGATGTLADLLLQTRWRGNTRLFCCSLEMENNLQRPFPPSNAGGWRTQYHGLRVMNATCSTAATCTTKDSYRCRRAK